ncbi:LysR family transcriptional regulator [Rahnella perminowiae]|uniref:LysR family transcriptional regulator n=1 Tax=Rahnella perminowiae TaxID=2816244 RepID=UPI00215B914E|nr:LysR family transcriptional regulator [Rahnella perminowiae]
MSNKFDYNLIKTLVLVYETKSMSKSAKALGLSSPTLTYALNKLRDYYNDPLFIKSSRGLKATPVANQLYPNFKKIDEDIASSVMISGKNYPEVADVIIRTNTMVEYFLMDKLLKNNKLREGINFTFNNRIMLEEQRLTALVSREVDIDIGSAIKHNHSFISTRIAQSKIIGLCRQGHPRIKENLSLEQWMKEEHAVLSSAETHAYLPEKLYANFHQRNIRYRSNSLLNMLHCIEKSDFVMFFPEFLLKHIPHYFNLQTVAIPWMEKDTLDVYAYIHSKAKNDERLLHIIDLLKL